MTSRSRGDRRRKALAHAGGGLLAARAASRSASMARRHGVEHVLVAERLGQEVDGAGLHGAHRHRDVAVAGHEDDRDVGVGLRQAWPGSRARSCPAAGRRAPGSPARRLSTSCRNSAAEPNSCTSWPTERKRLPKRVAHVLVVVDHEDGGQRRRLGRCRDCGSCDALLVRGRLTWKRAPPSGRLVGPDPPAMGLDDRAADRQAHAHAVRLGGEEGIEQAVDDSRDRCRGRCR